MAKYIDAKRIEKFIEDGLNCKDHKKRFGHDAIEIMAEVHYSETVDAVEVVRCKDCKFYHKQECAMDDWHFSETKEEDFCSFGQKK